MCIVDVNIARVHYSYDVSARRRNHKVTDAVVKATDIKQLCKCADVNESKNTVLTLHSQHLQERHNSVWLTNYSYPSENYYTVQRTVTLGWSA